jgi:hypothetical protein
MFAERHFRLAVGLLLAAMGTIQVVTALGETQIWDEGAHIIAGYANWKGDYRWNVEHPPLVKMMSALPLLPLRPKLPVDPAPWHKGDQIMVGLDFLYKNQAPADTLLFRARSMTILLTLLGGLLLALWTRHRFGAAAALIALAFYALDPNLIAHGRYVTTDVPIAVFFFLTCAMWTEWLLTDRRRDLVLAALCFSLAMVVKFSGILLIPVLVLLYALRWVQRPREFPVRRALTAVVVVAGLAVVVIGVVYLRETVRSLRPGGQLPKHAFVTGLAEVIEHNSGGHETYLMGHISQKGVWYYFPVVFGVKSTMAAVLAALLLIGVGLARLRRMRELPFHWTGMALPAVLYFGFSMSSSINLGVRHILPVYPLLYVLAGALLAGLAAQKAMWRTAVLALVGLHAVECALIYPDYLAHFNLASGGPAYGPHYLVDSNIDWGQDVKKLLAWLEAHGTRRVYLNYFGKADVKYYGIDELAPPLARETAEWAKVDGYVACSVTQLMGVYAGLEETANLRRLTPVAKVGYSIYVYDLRKRK